MRGFLSVAVLYIAVATFGMSPIQAQTIGYGEAIQVLASACGSDLEQNCEGVKPGAGALRACLINNQSNVSVNCLATVDITADLLAKRAAAQEAAPGLCANDARRHCSEFREGRARVLRCLIRPDIYRGVSKKCKTALIDAGWD